MEEAVKKRCCHFNGFERDCHLFRRKFEAKPKEGTAVLEASYRWKKSIRRIKHFNVHTHTYLQKVVGRK